MNLITLRVIQGAFNKKRGEAEGLAARHLIVILKLYFQLDLFRIF